MGVPPCHVPALHARHQRGRAPLWAGFLEQLLSMGTWESLSTHSASHSGSSGILMLHGDGLGASWEVQVGGNTVLCGHNCAVFTHG